MTHAWHYEQLKQYQHDHRDGFSEPLRLRVHRALSWLKRAEFETEDDDARFIFLWIAFNAAYANELPDTVRFSERSVLGNFVSRLTTLDRGNHLFDLVWDEFSGPIRVLINNQYVFQPFWDYQNGKLEPGEWERQFRISRKRASAALAETKTDGVLLVVLDRLYTLRNQLIHGGATWNGQVNRDQVHDGASLLGKLVPSTVRIMMENPQTIWGAPCYPVVG